VNIYQPPFIYLAFKLHSVDSYRYFSVFVLIITITCLFLHKRRRET